MRRSLLLLVVFALASATACGPELGGASDRASPAAAPEDFDVGTREEIFIDPSRDAGTARNRTLRTLISFPQRGGRVAEGRFPVVVFSHGLRGTPEAYRVLMNGWVRGGFVVVAPAYPMTERDAEAIAPRDVVQQPRDASFVLTSVLELGSQEGDPLEGHLDTERLAAAGHSLGGITTVGLFKSCCDDPRLDAGIVLAGNEFAFPGAFARTDAPVLFAHGDDDDVVSYGSARDAYEGAGDPKMFIRLRKGGHIAPYVADDDTHFAIVAATTLDFLNWTLRGDDAALDALRNHADEEPHASVDDEL